LALCGCGKAKKADENKPLSEVKTEAEKMNAGQLRETALAYKSAIEAKTADLEKVITKLQKVPLTEALGEEAKNLKADIDNLTKSLESLKQRFEVYYQKLKEKGGDLSGLEI
jgi:ABC-type transporter Mla subunit MlaD